MSGRALRIAGTDHVSPAAFVASVPSHGTLCQPDIVLPEGARRIQMLVGTDGLPVPALRARFLGQDGTPIASGRLAAGAHEGEVGIPLDPASAHALIGSLCIYVGKARHAIVIAGEPATASPESEQIDGVHQGGRIDVVYMRGRRESWWQMLPSLSRRFGLGKAGFFGDWTLPVVALALFMVWVGACRVLARELT